MKNDSKVFVEFCLLVLIFVVLTGCPETGSPLQDDPVNSAPTAIFYGYDYLVSGSATANVDGEYNFVYNDALLPKPGYINGNGIYIYRFLDSIDFNTYWGIYSSYSENNISTVYYYAPYDPVADPNYVPYEAGWMLGSGLGAVTVSTGSSIIGRPYGGESVTGNYIFSDLDYDFEGLSTYQWYLCTTNATDDEGVAITGATSKTYDIPDTTNLETETGPISKSGKYLKFEITPVDEPGGVGAAVKSEASYMPFPS